jgi:hypothetical protein
MNGRCSFGRRYGPFYLVFGFPTAGRLRYTHSFAWTDEHPLIILTSRQRRKVTTECRCRTTRESDALCRKDTLFLGTVVAAARRHDHHRIFHQSRASILRDATRPLRLRASEAGKRSRQPGPRRMPLLTPHSTPRTDQVCSLVCASFFSPEHP